MRATRVGQVVSGTLALFLGSVCSAHDIWLSPERSSLAKGDTLTVHLRVGHELNAELELPLSKGSITRFELITPNGSVDLLREMPDRALPVLKRKLDFEGLALLIMEHGFSDIELSSEKFAEHLKLEKLDRIERLRNQRGPKPTERERYARTLKCLIQVGESVAGQQITDADLRYLAGMTNVRALDLYGTQVTDAGLQHLRGLTNLRELNLCRTRVTDAGLAHLTALTNLQLLRLAGTQVTDAGLTQLQGLTNLKAVTLDQGSNGRTMPPMQLLGSKLDVRLLHNPYLLDPGDSLEVRVLFDGQPLGDKLVRAYNDDGTRRISMSEARTDPRGIARFTLERAGFWQIRLVHMLPCRDWPDVDWESYWASYSFKLD